MVNQNSQETVCHPIANMLHIHNTSNIYCDLSLQILCMGVTYKEVLVVTATLAAQ